MSPTNIHRRRTVRRLTRATVAVLAASTASLVLAIGCARRVAPPPPPPPPEKPFGIVERAAWTTSRVSGSPEAPSPFITERAFPRLTLKNPLDLEWAPGLNRWFIVQQDGHVYSFPNDETVDHADLVLDPAQILNTDKVPDCKGVGGSFGLAFHPNFEKNHYVYLEYNLDYTTYLRNHENGSRISRFTVTNTNPPTIDPSSEVLILQWLSGGHNGCSMKFGRDGYLYISMGDAGDPDPPDPFNSGQDINDLLCSILRIDVDHPADGAGYSIPQDNPFVKTPGARGEVYAYGLRNPWRMSFDRETGNLWVGDVGWELWENVYCVKPGTNCGWSIMEGPNPVHPDGKRGPTPITKPQAAMSHTESASLTGGIVYRGKKLPDLRGYYVYGDWQTSRLWAAKCNGDTLEPYHEIAQTDQRIVSFAEDPDGEPLIVDHGGGGIWRIVPNPDVGKPSNFPRRLSDTGLFTSVKDQTPRPGVIPFQVNASQWVDGAVATRWIALPGSEKMYWGKGVWGDDKVAWPNNSVLVRTLALETIAGVPSSKRNVETQVLHFDGKQWRAYTYAWNAAATDADLVGPSGEDRPVWVVDPSQANGLRRQNWHYASRSQCMTCHNVWCDYALAFNLPELDRVEKFASVEGTTVEDNQIRTFRHIGLLLAPKPPPPPDPKAKPAPTPPPPEKLALSDPYDASANLDERARSYLHINCSHCHRFGGGGSALIDVRKEMHPAETHLVDARAILGDFGIGDARIVCAGDPNRSVLLYRTSKLGRGRMPHIGSDVVDEQGTALLREWIAHMPPSSTPGEATAKAEKNDAHSLLTLHDIATPPAARDAAIDQLLGTTTGGMALLGDVQFNQLPSVTRLAALTKASTAVNPMVADLFRQFAVLDQQSDKLGSNVAPDRVLGLKGDAARGKDVFFTTAGGLCSKCHKVGGQGAEFGPELTHVATKYPEKAQILDNIFYPSKTIAEGFTSYVVKTTKGDLLSGLISKKTDEEIVIKDASLKEVHVPAKEIAKLVAQPVSAMPEGLLSDLSPQQAADLLEFLYTLK